MDLQPASSQPAARRAFWVAIALGGLALVGALASPLAGAFFAAIFFAIAWGIRRGQVWAAITGGCLLLLPIGSAASRWRASGGALNVAAFFVDALITFACVYWTWRAAAVMWRDSQTSRPAWPWIAVLLVMVSSWLCFSPFVMPAASMENTLLIGDYVLVETATWSLGRAPRPGDIVVVRYPVDRNQLFIKRIAGVPGDHLRIQNKQLYRNGSPVAEPYAVHNSDYVDSFRDNFPSTPTVRLAATGDDMLQNHVRGGELVVPEGNYFVLGDNRDNSLDSRYWGFISRGDILGSPFLIYGSAEGGKSPAAFHTRWSRLLKLL